MLAHPPTRIATMPTFDQLTAAAFNTERVRSRRLALRTGLSEHQALLQTLELAAAPHALAQLLLQRAEAQAREAARVAERRARQSTARADKLARDSAPAGAWLAWFDGSAWPNPGACGIGALLTGPNGERVEISRAAGYGNSSEAEYLALIALLEAAVQAAPAQLVVYGDSQGVIGDASGADALGAPSLQEYRTRAQALLAQLNDVTLRWIPRHKNGAADALAQRAR